MDVSTVARMRRDAAEVTNDGPILNLDETHCLSDWSLVIVIGIASANAIFFFYHMVLILAVRLRQQVWYSERHHLSLYHILFLPRQSYSGNQTTSAVR